MAGTKLSARCCTNIGASARYRPEFSVLKARCFTIKASEAFGARGRNCTHITFVRSEVSYLLDHAG